MATPSASSNAPKATQNVSTPQPHAHLGAFSSPAPRSVPSPATHRAQSGKSPFGASKHPTGSTIMAESNHPTGGSSASGAGKLLGSSPAAAMLGTDSPAAMMFNLSTGGVDGGVAMGFSMSNISGIALGKVSTTGRPDDEERRKRMMDIVRLLETRYPRISIDGIESLGNRYGGMDTVVEPPDRFKGVGECVVAGRNGNFMITIPFTESKQITSATFNFSDKASDAVRKHESTAQKAIMRTLSLEPGQSHITSSLEMFGRNLERLGRMDKLCGTGFSCFEAIAGVYNSLQRLYDHEKKIAMTIFDASKPGIEIRTEREVMCKRSGRPVMNPRKTVGLSLDYWMDYRNVLRLRNSSIRRDSERMDSDAMDIDNAEDSEDVSLGSYYSLIIECEENQSVGLHQPTRISNDWISSQVEKQSEDAEDLFGPTIDWLDPPPTYLNEPLASAAESTLQLDNPPIGKLPNVRFVARLDPPLVLPQSVAANLLASVNISLPQPEAMRTYTGLLLNTEATEDYNAIVMAQAKQIHSNTLTTVPEQTSSGNTFSERRHDNTLFIDKPELGRVLEEIPFSHPKQLVQLLPTLRQYAFLGHVLKDTFKDRQLQVSTKDAEGEGPGATGKVDINLLSATTPRFSVSYSLGSTANCNDWTPPTPESLTLEDLLNDNSASRDADVEMTNTAKPKITPVLFVQVDILPNADVQVSEHTLVPVPTETPSAEAEMSPEEQKYRSTATWLAKALDQMGGDVSCWTEAMAMKAKTLSHAA